MKKILFLVYVFLLYSCVTRTSRPQIEGYVYNLKKAPIKDVKVCIDGTYCVNTDNQGCFFIKRKFYKEISLPGREAPAVIYNLSLTKNRYSDTIIHYKNIYGGANYNLKVKYDTIILRDE